MNGREQMFHGVFNSTALRVLNTRDYLNKEVAFLIQYEKFSRENSRLLQIYDDNEKGRKVCSYYNLTGMPSILVIDSITRQTMQVWTSMIKPERLLDDLLPRRNFNGGGAAN